jgi:hypothetical protein
VRALAGGESDEAALQKLRELPVLEKQRHQLQEFEHRVRGLVSRRPNFRHIAAQGAGNWYEAESSGGASVDSMKSTLHNLTEMLHFEISAVELRATMHKADAQLALQPEGLLQATVRKVEQLLDVTSIDAVLPSMQEWRVFHIEAESSRNKLAEMLQLPSNSTWAEGVLLPAVLAYPASIQLEQGVVPLAALSSRYVLRIARALHLALDFKCLSVAARPCSQWSHRPRP